MKGMAGSNTEVQGQDAKSGKSGMLKFVIAGVAVVVLAAGISYGVFMFAAKSVAPQNGQAGDQPPAETVASIYDTGEFVTNLYSDMGNRFIKIRVVLGFQEKAVPAEIDLLDPEIKHVINATLRQQTPEGLAEPRAMETLADLLKKNINGLLKEGHVSQVYFTSFVVQ